MSMIVEDLRCIGCGYNLRHAPNDGVCSECGMEVASSIAGDQLVRADKKWLKKIRSGFTWVIASDFLLIVAAISSVQIIGEWGAIIALTAFVVTFSWGSWWVMAREDQRWKLCWAGRAITVAFFLGLSAGVAGQIMRAVSGDWRWSTMFGKETLIGACAMCAQKSIILLMARDVARRAFSQSLRWLCLLLVAGEFFLAGCINVNQFADWATIGPLTYAVMNWCMVVTSIAPIVVLWLIRRRISEAIRANTP